ncbi:MAG: hypothetical protein AB7E32_10000 [Desulfovibrio sp.]
MLKETITVHDKFQFEIKLSLPFASDGKKSIHGVETYLFLPNTLFVNPATLSREEFFGRLKNYIRLRIPWVALDDLDGPTGPLARLKRLLAEANSGVAVSRERYEDHVKVFCLATQRALRSWAFKTVSSSPDTAPEAAQHYIERSRSLLRQFRALANPIRDARFEASPACAYGDEFLSIVSAYNGFRILERLNINAVNAPCAEAASAMTEFLHEELDYRKNTLRTVVPDAKSDNELFVFRWSMLKKYMSSALFLEIRERRDSRFWQQVVYSLAAGAAMIFATGIAFIWQGKHGSLSMPLFTALIISYIFKDRMKDLLRASMSSWLRRVLSDRKLAIYRNITSAVGTCKETFGYISEKSLPREVAALRDKIHMVDVSNSFRRETVIRYHKDIILAPRAGKLSDSGFCDGMLDITRLGVHEFLRNMDEPGEPLYVLDGDACRRITGSKVYHVNMIRTRRSPEGLHCRRYRIVLDRDGIKRIERVR